ncbi:hypothetical protein DFH28DRAFT_1114804 [Melampsora americana]|nr:hypothetical protein DFH28DRAFT_1114804 [Melampsora americana]
MAVRFADGLAYGMWAAGGRQRGHLRKKGLQTGLMAAPRPRKQAGIDGLWPEAAYCRVIAAYGPLESAVLTRPQDPGDGMLTASPGPEDGSETGLGLRRSVGEFSGPEPTRGVGSHSGSSTSSSKSESSKSGSPKHGHKKHKSKSKSDHKHKHKPKSHSRDRNEHREQDNSSTDDYERQNDYGMGRLNMNDSSRSRYD